jgi:hypothetical protein
MALHGRYASVQLPAVSGTVTVQDLYSWTIDLASNPIVQSVFGNDGWSKTHGLASNAWSGTFEGIYSNTDTTGQKALALAQIASTMVSGVRFYMDAATNYYEGDLYITSQGIKTDPEDVVRVTYNYSGTGVLALKP